MERAKFTVHDFARKKKSGEKITMLTAYDCRTAQLVDDCGIDSIMVGDSLAMTVFGRDTTVSVTMEEVLHHVRAVKNGIKFAFLIADMPFLSYQTSDETAITNAGRFIKEGCDAVKLEGGTELMCRRIKAISDAGILVVGHLGLTPQSVSKMGGYKVQGVDASSAGVLMEEAKNLEKAGCFALILECLPKELSQKITKKVNIPTIGIGAGYHCDGQVLVVSDIIGYTTGHRPKFVKQYADVSAVISEAVKKFKSETESGIFPDDEHSY
ncbi:MAG: 3-methyl-2-oxobutanoate hydroxymethyltransferase [Candidatus Omnitrophica bacterium]|nr:3-methyl-2-oxobutanoate hydroxymethyltransferase [Candidatus Omnitrophota bacterium]